MSATVRDNPDGHCYEIVVDPLCPYIREVISQDASRYLQLVADDVRESLGLAHLHP